MLAIFRAYLDVTLLRRGPDSLPYSVPLLVLTALAVMLLMVLFPSDLEASMVQAVIVATFFVMMYCSVIWLVLNASGRTARFVPTMTAVFGAKLLLLLLQLAILLLAGGAVDVTDTGATSTPLMLLRLVEIWYVVVLMAILRVAMNIGPLQSFGMVLLISILLYGALSMVLPATAFSS